MLSTKHVQFRSGEVLVAQFRRTVASDTRGLRFESSHWRIFEKNNCIENVQVKKKRPGKVHLKTL